MRGVYLICFDSRLSHAKHYIGYANDIAKRIKRHRSNQGAKLLRALNLAGIAWHVVRVWKNKNREFERSLKNRKKSSFFCPMCNNDVPRCNVAIRVDPKEMQAI